MPQPSSPLAYGDIRSLFDRALDSQRGIRIKCESVGKAINFRHRVNGFRRTDRTENKKVYDRDDPLHGRTVYDAISVRIVGVLPDGREITYSKGSPDNEEARWEVRLVKLDENTIEAEEL